MKTQSFIILVILCLCWNFRNDYYKKQQRLKKGREYLKQQMEIATTKVRVFDEAKVTFNDAYPYQGFSHIELLDHEKLVALDVSMKGVQNGVELDSFSILNGEKTGNYGSYPDRIGLDPATGRILPEPDRWPDPTASMRMLLVFPVPKTLNSFRLTYWGRELTTQSVPIKAAAPAGILQPTQNQVRGNTPFQEHRRDLLLHPDDVHIYKIKN